MNRLPMSVEIGTLGELLVQLRLLEYGVQAAAPLKDSGKELVALNGRIVRTIQVKTVSQGDRFSLMNLPKLYDLVALVQLRRNNERLELDQCRIYLVPEGRCTGNRNLNARDLDDFVMTPELVKRLFS